MTGERRRLPIIEGPFVPADTRTSRLLVATWDRAVTPTLRASGEVLPEALADFIEGCRDLAARRPPAVGGTRGIPAEAGPANLRLMTTSDVAGLLGCSERNVRGLRSRGSLVARRRHHRDGWLFDPANVDAYIEKRAEPA